VSARGRALAFALAASAALGACKDDVTSPSPGTGLGKEFTLAVGQVTLVEGPGLRILFRAVSGDSRCPADVTCVWEGDATVALQVTGASVPAAPYELHTSGRFAHEATHGAYRITLVRLDPVPRAAAPPSASDYRATLVVVR
jgi:hypothetical protein